MLRETSNPFRTGRTAPVILGLAVVILAAMAFAVPPAPIPAGDNGAYLIGHGRLSAQLADQLSRSDYAALVIDFTGANLDEDALWRSHFRAVDRRGFPIWGWVDLDGALERGGIDQARAVARSEKLAGLYVHGPDAVDVAASLDRPNLKVIPVIGADDAPPRGEHAVVVGLDAFLAGEPGDAVAVLDAAGLSLPEIERARAAADGRRLVIARIALGK
jgi:hypothetical protein